MEFREIKVADYEKVVIATDESSGLKAIISVHNTNLGPAVGGTRLYPYANEDEALKDADFVYTKNWSSYEDYGKVVNTDPNWMVTKDKLGGAKFMHCLPVRRNVVVEDAVLDSDSSIVIEQANNRTYAVQLVLKKLLENA